MMIPSIDKGAQLTIRIFRLNDTPLSQRLGTRSNRRADIFLILSSFFFVLIRILTRDNDTQRRGDLS